MDKYNGTILVEKIKELVRPGSILQFEKELGLTKGHTYKFVDSAPTAETLIAIADHFNVSIDYLLGRNILHNEDKKEEIIDVFLQMSSPSEDQLEWIQINEKTPVSTGVRKWAEKEKMKIYQGLYCIINCDDIEDKESYAVLLIVINENEDLNLKLLLMENDFILPTEEMADQKKLTRLLNYADNNMYIEYSNNQNKKFKKKILDKHK